jgi:hypothetical protein
MRAEEAIAAQLERQLGSLSPGHRHRVLLEQVVDDGFGRYRNGPHTVGWVERVAPDHLMIRLIPTKAGRTARALLEEDMLDVVLSHDYPSVVRLTG